MLRLWRIISWGLFLLCPCIAAGLDLLNGPESVVYDSVHNRYLVINMTGGQIIEIDEYGKQSVFASGLVNGHGICISGDTLLVGSNYGDHPGLNGYSLTTKQWLFNILEGGKDAVNGITVDTSGNAYVSRTAMNLIWKVNLSTLENWAFAGVSLPNAIHYDARNNRLLVTSDVWWTPVYAINMVDSAVSPVGSFTGQFSGIAEDVFHNYYVAFFNYGLIYKCDSNFTEPPSLFASGLSGPEGICMNLKDNILAIPNLLNNTIDFTELFVTIDADTTWGCPPLEVSFGGNSDFAVDRWLWRFGDGDSSLIQNPSHVYTGVGNYDVSLEINSGTNSLIRSKRNFINILADSIIASSALVEVNSAIVAEIYARNTTPLNVIRVPVEYDGTLGLVFDSFSTDGCRTSYFDTVMETSSDPDNKRNAIKIWNYNVETPDLEAGSGTILKLFFTASKSSIPGRTANICVDGYSTELPSFGGFRIQEYFPIAINGILEGFVCGDCDKSGQLNVLDVSFIINYLYRGGQAPHPSFAADVDSSGMLNILDVSYIISYLYKGGPRPICVAN